MKALSASVIIVSRGRPELLTRCVQAVSQLWYHPFEIVVVADRSGLQALKKTHPDIAIKSATFEEPNISMARNIGLFLAAGDVVAFVDDDAVPEPGWLHHLAGAFDDPDVAAATGFVLGRNGISIQSTAVTVNETGGTDPLDIVGDAPVVFTGKRGKAVKTVGTNCAFRRKIFSKTQGFDPGFRYFLDETDLNIRLAHWDQKTAIVPMALVHHNPAASDTRAANRLPKSLFEVGASTAVFLRKHDPDGDHSNHLKSARASQRKTLMRHMVNGTCEPGDVTRLLATFDKGAAEGQTRPLSPPPIIADPASAFLPCNPVPPEPTHQIISGYRLASARLHHAAKSAVRPGNVVSLYVLSRTALFHRISYHRDGYWLQTGGIFGRSLRQGRLFRATTLLKRTDTENRRIAPVRHPWHMPNPTSDVGKKNRYGSL